MPEGPSIVILREEVFAFKGKKILEVYGNSKVGIERLYGKKILDFKSWGKHFLIVFKDFYLKIHMLMWGTYRINEKKDAPARLGFKLQNGELNFYSCSIKLIEGDPDIDYDYETDVMSPDWNEAKALKTVKKLKDAQACDVLMNQDIFSGVGNIIKNEVLFRIKVHPESLIGHLPIKKTKELVKEAHKYSHEFYHWKKAYVLKKNFLIYKKSECPRCKLKTKRKYLGKGKRLTCYCENCQVLYK